MALGNSCQTAAAVLTELGGDGMNNGKNLTPSGADRKAPIYVVDDEEMLLDLASVILAPLGYEIRTFRDPEAALRAFTATQPRPVLLITDYAMHRMNGMALIDACRRVEPSQKVLLISGTVGPEIQQGAPSKPDGYLAKPFLARELVKAVETLLAT